ncbi:hypothetical protein BU17DRAFT_70909 [Hysterangium stoloniferum]|nr:hypothetical protein BU17DRAFT_70909 [Hysterangium stoloniferum]
MSGAGVSVVFASGSVAGWSGGPGLGVHVNIQCLVDSSPASRIMTWLAQTQGLKGRSSATRGISSKNAGNTPHLREASTFLPLKRQQVKLLQAVAILSLPEDGSLWLVDLFGRLLPIPGSLPTY